jgi:hypothetical protein
LVAPVRLIGKDNVAEIECVKMELAEYDSSGRRPEMTVESKESGRFDAWLLTVVLAAAVSVAVFIGALILSDAARKDVPGPSGCRH